MQFWLHNYKQNITMDTKALRQKILDLAIRGKLVPQDPNDEPASVLLERIKAEKERLIKEGKIKKGKKSAKTSDTPHYPYLLPHGWEWCRLNGIGEVITGNTPSKDRVEYYGGNIPFFKPTDLEQGIDTKYASDHLSELGFEQSRKLPANTILVTCIGATIGKTGITTVVGSCNQQINAIVPYYEMAHSFIYYVCVSGYMQNEIKNNASATTLPILNKGNFANLLFPLPPIAEQYRIVAEIEKWGTFIDQIEQGKADLQTTIKQTKSKILDLAIHGKLVPQDPNDEPAIELLKRINPDFTPCDNGHYPNGWQQTILGELFYHNTGKALNSSNKEGVIRNYLTTSNVYWNKFDFTVIKQMPFKESELDKCTVTKGDLLVCEGGDIGRSAIWNYDYDICIQNHIHRLRPKIDLCVLFYYYALAYLKENNLIGGKGIGLLGLSSNALHKIELPLPPLTEQQRIVQKIEELFSVLDNIQNALEV